MARAVWVAARTLSHSRSNTTWPLCSRPASPRRRTRRPLGSRRDAGHGDPRVTVLGGVTFGVLADSFQEPVAQYLTGGVQRPPSTCRPGWSAASRAAMSSNPSGTQTASTAARSKLPANTHNRSNSSRSVGGEQTVGPVERGRECAVAVHAPPGAAAQQPESVTQAVQHLGWCSWPAPWRRPARSPRGCRRGGGTTPPARLGRRRA